ncbi:hypothetical protein HDV05_005144 [Chytridiales sp. JEL 0842]|nr:hypothetical protein HDV05_005144 [Chytridiales sp. JEL 0842]
MSKSSGGGKIAFSSTGTHFLVGSGDLKLYEWNAKAQDHHHHQPLEPRYKLVTNLVDTTPVKCFDWSPQSDVFAVGYTTGKTSLVRCKSQAISTTDGHESSGDVLEVLGEHLPRHMRACNVVAFCPTAPNLLLSGLDKVRNDFCLFVWNTESILSAQRNTTNPLDSSNPIIPSFSQSQTSTLLQFGVSEAVSSAAWFPTSTPRLIAGMGFKWLRVFDLRTTSGGGGGDRPTSSSAGGAAPSSSSASQAPSALIATKLVQGLTTDPFDPLRFASYGESTVALWDMRKTAEPVWSFETPWNRLGGVGHLQFSGERRGCLSAVGKEGKEVLVWDVRVGGILSSSGGVGGEETSSAIESGGKGDGDAGASGMFSGLISPLSETTNRSEGPASSGVSAETQLTSFVYKTRQIQCAAPVLGFAWIPSPGSSASSKMNVNAHRLMTSHPKDVLEIVTLPILKQVAMGASGEMIVSHGGGGSLIRHKVGALEGTDALKLRAQAGYGLDPVRNLSIIPEDCEEIRNAWSWLAEMKAQSHLGRTSLHGIDYAMLGIEAAIMEGWSKEGSGSTHSVTNFLSPSAPFACYISDKRKLALHLCGWDFDGENSLEKTLLGLERSNMYEKAAGLALFHSASLHRAVHALNSSKDEKLKLVATALAGFMSGTPGSMWLGLCRSLSNDLQDPYLRSMFALISTGGDWHAVLQTKGLSFRDKLGIALRFLNDAELVTYLKSVKEKKVEAGDLEGIILTGFGTCGVDLCQNYLDRTGDLQSVTLLFCASVGQQIDPRVQNWVET